MNGGTPSRPTSVRRGALTLGAVALGAAVATGSRVLGVVGVGFLLAGVLTHVWAWLVDAPVAVGISVEPVPAVEGDRVRVELDVRRRSRLPLGSLALGLQLGRLGVRQATLHGHGRRARGSIDLGELPRGVFDVSAVEIELGDLLGLVSVRPQVATERTSVIVRPRLVGLEALFSDAGRSVGDGRRVLLHRAAGFDFHSVREYEQGESLRRVHWPTSARRGQLMVKELEDTAHDGVVVVLDCDPRYQVGEPPDSSFDTAVRATGSLLLAHARRGRPATLVSTGRDCAVVQVRSAAADFDGALAALSAAQPDATGGIGRVLAGDHPWLANGEIAVVTASDDPAAFAQLVALAGRRLVEVVWVDAASFARRPTKVEPGLLRLAAHGIPTAVVRRGDDLASALSAADPRAVAHA